MRKLIGEKLVEYRREFHKYPETSWTEFRTSSRIAEVLSELGYEIFIGKEVIEVNSVMGRASEEEIQSHIERALAQGANAKLIERMDRYTGVLGILNTGIQGPVIALRFDIDANDVIEISTKEHIPYSERFSSVNKNVMHACGHDGHIAIGLGLAELLMAQKHSLTGIIKLIFQPAEESAQGAKAMVDKGILDDVDYFISGHLGFGVKGGTIVVDPSGFLSITKFDVKYVGKGSHAGAAPNEGNNALLAAASAVLNLYSIAPHKDGITRINVGILNGGTGRNVIAPKAYMQVETRGSTQELNEYMFEKAGKIIEYNAKMYDLSYEIKVMGEGIGCNSDEELVEIAASEAIKIEGIKQIQRGFYFGASEDVTWMMKRVQERGGKAIFMIFGTNIAAQHHNEGFDFEEDILVNAAGVLNKMISAI